MMFKMISDLFDGSILKTVLFYAFLLLMMIGQFHDATHTCM